MYGAVFLVDFREKGGLGDWEIGGLEDWEKWNKERYMDQDNGY
jgi:hypothetical protein